GWDITMLYPDGNTDRNIATDLASASPYHPVFLVSDDTHDSWVDTKALNLAGITSSTANPTCTDGQQCGVIDKFTDTGEPTGMLRQYASLLVSKHVAQFSADNLATQLKSDIAWWGQMGITQVQAIPIPPFQVHGGQTAADEKNATPAAADELNLTV